MISQSYQLLTGTVSISDATVTATATRIAGSDEQTGTATLLLKGTAEAKVTLQMSGGRFAQVLNQSGGTPDGSWEGSDGIGHSVAMHNCWIPTAWFFPAAVLSNALANPSMNLAYVDQESWNGITVWRIRFWQQVKLRSAASVALIGKLSAADVLLDSSTMLPAALDFNLHPDNDASQDIAAEIRFSQYKRRSGVLLPTKIQQYLNNSLYLDLTVQSLVLNSGLTDADFTLQ